MVAFVLSPIGRALSGLLLLTLLWFGIQWWGASRYSAGVNAERVEWQAKADAEREKQAAVKQAVEAMGAQVVTQLGTRMAGLEQQMKDLNDVAAAEDEKPVPEACRDVFRGFSPDVLRRLQGVR